MNKKFSINDSESELTVPLNAENMEDATTRANLRKSRIFSIASLISLIVVLAILTVTIYL